MHGGVMNMKGERQMIYKNVRFKADPFSYDLNLMIELHLLVETVVPGKQYFINA